MSEQAIKRFNIRVYGILVDDGHVLTVEENDFNMIMFKYPGGGLEFGEGTADCVVREFKEEVNLDIEVVRHFYTTDFFQQSTFKPEDQLLSIYYLVKDKHSSRLRDNEEAIVPHWVPLDQLKAEMMTFPIDQHVTRMLLDTYPL